MNVDDASTKLAKIIKEEYSSIETKLKVAHIYEIADSCLFDVDKLYVKDFEDETLKIELDLERIELERLKRKF